jgi:hypothetical protein
LGANVKFFFRFVVTFFQGNWPYWGELAPFIDCFSVEICGAGGEFWVCLGVGMVKKIFAGV